MARLSPTGIVAVPGWRVTEATARGPQRTPTVGAAATIVSVLSQRTPGFSTGCPSGSPTTAGNVAV
jgi:hypothetical protein